MAHECSGSIAIADTGSTFVNRTIWAERMEYECEGDVVRHVRESISPLPLYHDIADVAPCANRRLVERGCLSRLPLDQEIACPDGARAPQQSERPRLVASRGGLDRHDALHRLDAVGKRPVIQEGLFPGRVIADIGIAPVIARVRIARDEHLARGEAMAKAIERFQSRRNEPQPLPSQCADDGLAGELLPPALGLPV